jgi:predicted metal-dependent hydrolase
MPPVRPAAGDKIHITTFRLGLEELKCVLILSKKRKKTLSYAVRYEELTKGDDADDNVEDVDDDIDDYVDDDYVDDDYVDDDYVDDDYVDDIDDNVDDDTDEREAEEDRTVSVPEKEPVIFVRAPDGMAIKRVLSVLSDNEANLIDLLEKAKLKEKAVETKLKKTYTNGSLFYYLGRTYALQLFFDETKNISVHLLDGKLQIYVPSRLKALPDHEREQKIKKAIDAFYIEQADIYFNARADYFSQKYLSFLGSRPKSVKTTFYKGKWGCCTYDNHIKLNWVLIQADTRIVDYIIVHELCHIRFKDHSANFWALVEKMDPHYKEKKQELKENGWVLGIK